MKTTAVAVIVWTLAATTPALAQYQLVWSDEFDGTQVDLSRWEMQIGTGCPSLCGWGNNELEFYRAENATVGGGMLTITAKEESFGGRSYTSARMRTLNQGDWTYGRFEARIKLPTGQGIWPAFWMLPTDNVYGGWPASGELDIMELVGHEPNKVHGTIHYGDSFPSTFTGDEYQLGSGIFNDDFHVFAVEWEPNEIRWYVDGIQYQCRSSWFSSTTYPAPFDQDFHLLLNVAVGGNWPGNPDGSTVFPQEMVVDYVRVYQKPTPDPYCCVLFDGMDHNNPFANGWFVFNGNGGGGINSNTVDLPPDDACGASLESGWGGAGPFIGGFGREFPLDLTDMTHFELWINPDPGQTYTLEINLQDDDNGDDSIPGTPNGQDDEFQYNLQVSPTGPDAIAGGGWQKISIPLSSFFDDNSYHWGGNGIWDPTPVSEGGNGQLILVVITVISPGGGSQTFRTDHWNFVNHSLTPIYEGPSRVTALGLGSPSPNPFAATTVVDFRLPRTGEFRLDVYDLRGRRVRQLAQESRPAGDQTVAWDGRGDDGRPVASGVYVLRLEQGGTVETAKIARRR